MSPTEFTFTNTHAAQPLQWTVRSTAKQPLAGVALELNGRPVVELKERTLPPGGSLKYTGGAAAVLCDATGKELDRVPMNAPAGQTGSGPQRVKITSAEQPGASLKMELRTLGPATRIGSGQAVKAQ